MESKSQKSKEILADDTPCPECLGEGCDACGDSGLDLVALEINVVNEDPIEEAGEDY